MGHNADRQRTASDRWATKTNTGKAVYDAKSVNVAGYATMDTHQILIGYSSGRRRSTVCGGTKKQRLLSPERCERERGCASVTGFVIAYREYTDVHASCQALAANLAKIGATVR